MPEGEFELRAVEWTPASLAVVGLMLVVSTLHLALSTSTEQARFAVLGLGLLVCFVVYFTDLWRPDYYLAASGFVVLMAVVWVVSGLPMTTLGLVRTLLEVALVGLFLYRYFAERRDRDPEEAAS